MSDQPVDVTVTAQLLDGRVVSLRRLTTDDADAIRTLHQHLSDHDRYYRFFTLQPVQLDEVIGELTEPAQGQYALGAFDATRLIGVANYTLVGEAGEAGEALQAAEVAIVVAHEDHSLGVGTALLKRLARIARAHGIGRFVADVLGDNHLMLTVFFDLGWPCEPMDYGSIRHVEIELPDFAEEASTSANAIS
jgi:GNAT superfamily N-acetyltransferase